MLEHVTHCVASFMNTPLQMNLAVLSFAIAVAAVIGMRIRSISLRQKMYLIYVHLAALFFPLIFFALSMKCGGSCDMELAQIAAYSVPAAFAASFAFGFLGVPQLYLRTNFARKASRKSSVSKFVAKHAAKLDIPVPAIFFADSQRPYAFSFSWPRSMIVLSVGLSDILQKKEVEAVLLHELYHARSKASLVKLSTFFMKFSPLAIFKKFNDELDSEEISADLFAATVQGTRRYLLSAKKKVGPI